MLKQRILKSLDYQLVQPKDNKYNQTPATLHSVYYRCQIINNILKTTLIQTFQSKSENEFSETLYYFPLEEDICLESFQARFNERTIIGIVKDKKSVLKEYDSNKNEGNLVTSTTTEKNQEKDYLMFRLGNLPPSQNLEITLCYSQQLNAIFNKYYIAQIPLLKVKGELLVKSEMDFFILDLQCTSRITYANSKGHPTQKTMIDDNTVRFNIKQALFQQNEEDFQLIFSFEKMFKPSIIFGLSKMFNEDQAKRAISPISHSAMLSFIPNFNENIQTELDDTIRAAISKGDDIISDGFQQNLNLNLIDHLSTSQSEFIFLLDRSGSMTGQPIQNACEALILFLKSLPNNSYFNVISFGSSFQYLFPKSQCYNSLSLNKAIQMIQNFSADLGSTNIFDPLESIFKEKRIQGYNKQIFLFTDGEVSQPEEVINLIKRNKNYCRVHSIGFGIYNDRNLIEQSAKAGKGISKFVNLSSDLSEEIIDILINCISPTYDDFSISYDKTIFESTYPSTINFPYIFKDEIINIHFFLKPLVDFSSLSEAQKQICIQYYDSYKKEDIKQVIRLEMADCFTCNTQLQESIFKIGKQMQLKENLILQRDIEKSMQESIDYQLLTEETGIICVIEILNDEQKILYENINHTIVYQQSQQLNLNDKFLPEFDLGSTNYMTEGFEFKYDNDEEECQQPQSNNDNNDQQEGLCEKSDKSIEEQKQCDEQEEEYNNNCLNQNYKTKSPIEYVSILNLVDSFGVWYFDQNLINNLLNGNQEQIKQFSQQFTTNDAFMTLSILVVLEYFFEEEKMKWILISKKANIYIKQNLKEGIDLISLKQQIKQKITINP